MWEFDDLWQFWKFTWTMHGLATASDYYDWIVGTVQPTIDFMYDKVLTNPIFIWLIVVLLVLSLFTFHD